MRTLLPNELIEEGDQLLYHDGTVDEELQIFVGMRVNYVLNPIEAPERKAILRPSEIQLKLGTILQELDRVMAPDGNFSYLAPPGVKYTNNYVVVVRKVNPTLLCNCRLCGEEPISEEMENTSLFSVTCKHCQVGAFGDVDDRQKIIDRWNVLMEVR